MANEEIEDEGDDDNKMIPVTPVDPTQLTRQRNDSVAKLIESAYARAGTLQLTKEESDALQEDFADEDFRTGAGGKENLIYIEHAALRDRLNGILGLGQWTLLPIKEWSIDEEYKNRDGKLIRVTKIYREMALMVRGCFVGSAIGDMDYYPDNGQQNYGDAYEGAKTAAFRRCAKEFGVGLQAWRKGWGEGWFNRRRAGQHNWDSPHANGMQEGAKNATQVRREAKQADPNISRGEQVQNAGQQQPQQSPPQQGGQRKFDNKICPKCGAEAVMRSLHPIRGGDPNAVKGWYCNPKSGGCASGFPFEEFSEQQTQQPKQEDGPSHPGAQAINDSICEWSDWAKKPDISLESFNRVLKDSGRDFKTWHKEQRTAVWGALVEVAKGRGWIWNQKAMAFVEKQ